MCHTLGVHPAPSFIMLLNPAASLGLRTGSKSKPVRRTIGVTPGRDGLHNILTKAGGQAKEKEISLQVVPLPWTHLREWGE